MHSTLNRAGRTTHLKIVLVSLVATIAVVAVGLNARTGSIETTGTADSMAAIKAGKAQHYVDKERATVR